MIYSQAEETVETGADPIVIDEPVVEQEDKMVEEEESEDELL